jgi:hypothetical protein
MDTNKLNEQDDDFSDSEEMVENIEEEEDTRSDDEMAEYLKSIVSITSREQLDLSTIMKKEKNTKASIINTNTNTKTKKTLSLVDFNNKIDEVIQNSKPKKFVSKRVEEKKVKVETNDIVVKRSFEPRLPPYNFVHKHNNYQSKININDTDLFPTLQ